MGGPILELEVPAAEREAALQTTELQAREELGNIYELVELCETATVDRLLQDLEPIREVLEFDELDVISLLGA